MEKKKEITSEDIIALAKEIDAKQIERSFKYSTWSIMNLPHLNHSEKVALAFVNAATPIGGISTGQLQKYLGVSKPTMHRILKGLVQHKEIKHGRCVGIWVVTETEKLF